MVVEESILAGAVTKTEQKQCTCTCRLQLLRFSSIATAYGNGSNPLGLHVQNGTVTNFLICIINSMILKKILGLGEISLGSKDSILAVIRLTILVLYPVMVIVPSIIQQYLRSDGS